MPRLNFPLIKQWGNVHRYDDMQTALPAKSIKPITQRRMITMDLGVSDKVKPIIEEVKHFIDIEIMPMETVYHTEIGKGDRWTYTERPTEILESLKSKAKAKNLWNCFLTHYERRHGLNTVAYSYLSD